MTRKAERIVADLFGAFMADLRLLPPQFHDKVRAADEPVVRARVVADYIAGMTDRYAIREHKRLFDPVELT
jgi:dGTPase